MAQFISLTSVAGTHILIRADRVIGVVLFLATDDVPTHTKVYIDYDKMAFNVLEAPDIINDKLRSANFKLSDSKPGKSDDEKKS